VQANLASRVKKGKMAQAAADATMARVKGALDYSSFKSVDMVIEAVIEDVGLKQRIFADLEANCSPQCILATNTSTIDIDLVCAFLRRLGGGVLLGGGWLFGVCCCIVLPPRSTTQHTNPNNHKQTKVGAKTRAADRIVGAHFFSPAHVMPLLEIVRTTATSKQVVLDTLALASQIKKTPVVVGNCTGFAVNRVFFPYTMAAILLADCGVNPYMVRRSTRGAVFLWGWGEVVAVAFRGGGKQNNRTTTNTTDSQTPTNTTNQPKHNHNQPTNTTKQYRSTRPSWPALACPWAPSASTTSWAPTLAYTWARTLSRPSRSA
jgi:hypothetical protein